MYRLSDVIRLIPGPEGKKVVDTSRLPKPLRWFKSVTPELRLAGLNLLADLHNGIRIPSCDSWAEDEFKGDCECSDEGKNGELGGLYKLGQLWSCILQSSQGSVKAYSMMRSYYSWLRSLNDNPTELYHEQLRHNGTTAKGLLTDISDSLQAHLQRGLVQLPQPGQAYLEYVNRVLLNYRYYGTIGLRPSDLSEGDAVFSRVGSSILAALSRKAGLPTATAIQGLIDEYLVKVPSDSIILQRLATLPVT